MTYDHSARLAVYFRLFLAGKSLAPFVELARRIRSSRALPPVTHQQEIWNAALGRTIATFDFCVRHPLPPCKIMCAAAAALGDAAAERREVRLADLARSARRQMTAMPARRHLHGYGRQSAENH